MAAITGDQQNVNWKIDSRGSAIDFATVLVPFGRALFSLIFIVSGLTHFTQASIGFAVSQNVPAAQFLVPLSGLIAIAGGLSVLLGYKARIGALALVVFLIPVTLFMHSFWAVSDPAMYQIQVAHFMKNIALIGGAFLICYFGAGPGNLESWIESRKRTESI